MKDLQNFGEDKYLEDLKELENFIFKNRYNRVILVKKAQEGFLVSFGIF